MQNNEDNPYAAPNESDTVAAVLVEDEAMLVRRGRRIYLAVAATLLLFPLVGQILSGAGLHLGILAVPAVLSVLLSLGWCGIRPVLTMLVLAALFYSPTLLFPVLVIGVKFFDSAGVGLLLVLSAAAVYVAILWALTLSRSVQAFFAYQRRRFARTDK